MYGFSKICSYTSSRDDWGEGFLKIECFDSKALETLQFSTLTADLV